MEKVMEEMKKYFLWIVLLVVSACQDDLKTGNHSAGDEIRFATESDSIWAARSAESGEAMENSGRHFLGMMDGDSLFITLTVMENRASGFPDTARATASRGTYGTVGEIFLDAYLEGGQTFMNNQQVTNTSGKWEYTPVKYWPQTQSVDFLGYAWSVGSRVISSPFTRQGETSYDGTFSYTLPAAVTSPPYRDAENQPDLIFATALNQTKENNPVHLTFYHALSAIVFKLGTMPEDVTVREVTVRMEEVCAGGTCKITVPVSGGSSFAWTPGEEKSSYTQTFTKRADEAMLSTDEETFMMIPQPMEKSEAVLQVAFRIGEKDYVYRKPFSDFSKNITEWEPNKRYIYTLSTNDEYVEVDVDDDCTPTVKSNVMIQNTGLKTSYIRAAIVGYWAKTNAEGGEEIVSTWNIDDTDTGTWTKPNGWDTYWEKRADGFYYHKEPVEPGNYTVVPLIEKYELLKTTGPISGSKLYIHVVAQIIDADNGKPTDATHPWNISE